MSNDTQVISNATNKMNVRMLVQIGMLGAVAVVLMLFKIPLWFAPPFYTIDLSEIPVLIGAFAMGPVAGICIELVKILLNLLINGSTTAGIGEIANFLIGCSFIVPAGMVYKRIRSRKGALVGMVTGTVLMTVVGCCMNAWVLLPAFAAAFGTPIDQLVAMGSVINSSITGITSFVLFAVAPFNLLKGVLVSIVTFILYHHVSPILKKGMR